LVAKDVLIKYTNLLSHLLHPSLTLPTAQLLPREKKRWELFLPRFVPSAQWQIYTTAVAKKQEGSEKKG
jgi:hypothetical protein